VFFHFLLKKLKHTAISAHHALCKAKKIDKCPECIADLIRNHIPFNQVAQAALKLGIEL